MGKSRDWASDYRESGCEEMAARSLERIKFLKRVCGKEEDFGKIAAKWDSEEIGRKA